MYLRGAHTVLAGLRMVSQDAQGDWEYNKQLSQGGASAFGLTSRGFSFRDSRWEPTGFPVCGEDAVHVSAAFLDWTFALSHINSHRNKWATALSSRH